MTKRSEEKKKESYVEKQIGEETWTEWKRTSTRKEENKVHVRGKKRIHKVTNLQLESNRIIQESIFQRCQVPCCCFLTCASCQLRLLHMSLTRRDPVQTRPQLFPHPRNLQQQAFNPHTCSLYPFHFISSPEVKVQRPILAYEVLGRL